MAAATASSPAQRTAILGSRLHGLDGFCLAVDCGTPRCRGEHTYALAELAGLFGRQRTVGEVVGPGCAALAAVAAP